MEGACVFIKNNLSILLMYKEINNKIFLVEYSNYNLIYGFMEIKNFTNYIPKHCIPKHCIHILTKLPIDKNSLYNTLEIWKSMAKTKLLILNNREKYKL